MLEIKAKGLGRDVIIRDVDRFDGYPKVDEEEQGISSWFRAGFIGTYTRGIKVGLQIGTLTACKNGYRYTNHGDGESGDIKVFLIGEIPYDSIIEVNWDGDEYYYFPHIYCFFNYNGEPYERLAFCEKIDMGHDYTYYREVAQYEDVRKNSEGSGAEYFA